MNDSSTIVEDHFRREYGNLVATLCRRVGLERLEDVEDAVQAAMVAALRHWTIDGLPDSPSAWMYRTAHNELMTRLRTQIRRQQILHERMVEDSHNESSTDSLLPGELRDNLLRMLFVCCDESIPLESQLVLALKILCGFDVREISTRLFASQSNVYKRLGRAREQLRSIGRPVFELTPQHLTSRLASVLNVLYVMFTEGYLSSHSELAVRRELCLESIRLSQLLVEHPSGQTAESFALLALMHLHVARMASRDDARGGLLLLEEQDRRLWDRERMREGLYWLATAATGNRFSRYHAEAGIAAEHCLAPSFAETRWDRIVENYEILERITGSPLHRINRAVALAEWKGPHDGLALLRDLEPPTWLTGSYYWTAVLADLHRRCGHNREALRYRDLAIRSAPSQQVRELLERRLQIPAAG